MGRFQRHETSARDHMPDAGDDRELIYTPLAPFAHVPTSPSASWVPPVGLPRTSIERTMLLDTFHLTFNHYARKPLAHRGYRLSPWTINLERECDANLLPNTHMGVVQVQ